MPHLLFKLAGVHQDEIDAVHDCLDEASVDYYETTAGTFGLGVAAIWVRDKDEFTRAKEVMLLFHQSWAEENQGRQTMSFGRSLLAYPGRYLSILLVFVLLCLLLISPVLVI